MRPSEKIQADMPKLREKVEVFCRTLVSAVAGPVLDSEWEEMKRDRTMFGEIERSAVQVGILEHLDEEAERCTAFECGVLGRLDLLERSQPALEKIDACRVPESLATELTTQADAVASANPFTSIAGSGDGEAFRTVKAPTRCSRRMPDTPHQGQSERVMFFVPSELATWRWRTGRYVLSGHRTSEARWQTDDTMVGDECHEFAPDEVTHWMPMPGEP